MRTGVQSDVLARPAIVHGQPVQYLAGADSGMVNWASDGFSYSLSYSNLKLSRDDVRRIIESLK